MGTRAKSIVILSLIAAFFIYLFVSGDRPSMDAIVAAVPNNTTENISVNSSNVTDSYRVFTPESCTSGWYVTGYFTPREEDYEGVPMPVEITHLSNGSTVTRAVKEDFLDVVSIEGWGLTESGDYIGAWSGSFWGPNAYAADFFGDPLKQGSIAVDTSIIPHGKIVMIPTLPYPWNAVTFNATDIGNSSVTGMHIDVFTGEGRGAERETFRITGTDNIVCIGSVEYVSNNSV